MQISLRNETVVITGGAKRLGRAIALECFASGANVVITYNNSQSEADETIQELLAARISETQKAVSLHCDLTKSQEIARLADDVSAAIGTPTALVNNAAIFRRTPFAETEYSRWEEAFDEHIAANLKAPYLLSKIFGDLFLQQKRGAIINLADIYGSRPLKNYTSYCLSKAGVLMLTQTLAKALAPHVRVNAICPGTILLPSEAQGDSENESLEGETADEEAVLMARIPLNRLGTPAEIAAAVVFLIGGPQFISGVALPVDGAQILR